MKKAFLLFIIILPFISFSQEQLTVKSGGRVFNSNSEKLTPTYVKTRLESNPEALKLYQAGRAKKTFGNILLYGGISTVLVTHLIRVSDSNIDKNGNLSIKTRSNALYFVGAASVLIAIPIKIGFTRKIKKSVSLINQDLKNPKIGSNIESTTFISNSNGVGFSITF